MKSAHGERKFLLFCPDQSGHRHLYCRYFAEYLNSRGFRPTLAYAGRALALDDRKVRRYEDFVDEAARSLIEGPDVDAINVRDALNGARDGLKVAADVGSQLEVTDIVHVDGDLYRNSPQFVSANSKLSAFRNYLVLLITEYGDVARYDVSALIEARRLLKGLIRRNWFAEIATGRGTGCHYFPRFTRRVVRHLVKSPVVTRIIHCDERTHDEFGRKSVCVPEIGTSGWTQEVGGTDAFAIQTWQEVERFCQARPDKQPVMMMGDLEQRKGYALLVGMCDRLKDTICIRVGRTKPGYTQTWETVSARERLLKEGRLYEMDCYMASWEIFRKLLTLARIAVIPYRRHYRTSGWFTDAIAMGLPVIVPDRGLMAYRVRRYGLGEVFKEGNLDALCIAFRTVQEQPGKYQAALDTYAQSMKRDAIYSQWDECFELSTVSVSQAEVAVNL